MHKAIMNHLLENNLLSKVQFGFRHGASTQEAILKVARSLHQGLDKNVSVACIFFDISKAFDSLPHHLILSSLARVGICGSLLSWQKDM